MTTGSFYDIMFYMSSIGLEGLYFQDDGLAMEQRILKYGTDIDFSVHSRPALFRSFFLSHEGNPQDSGAGV